MNEKAKQKIQKLLALANDASDEESMTALAKARELMLAYQVTEDELFDHKQQQTNQRVIDEILYSGRSQKWLYRLAAIIAQNFRVKYYYVRSSNIELRFIGIESDVQIARITFEYARGSIAYCEKLYAAANNQAKKKMAAEARLHRGVS